MDIQLPIIGLNMAQWILFLSLYLFAITGSGLIGCLATHLHNTKSQ